MKNRRQKFWKAAPTSRFHFINAILFLVALSFFANTFVSFKADEQAVSFHDDALYYRLMQVNFLVMILTLLFVVAYVIHASTTPLARIEQILDEVIGGNHSLRVKLRKSDRLDGFAGKLNKVLDLLEAKKSR